VARKGYKTYSLNYIVPGHEAVNDIKRQQSYIRGFTRLDSKFTTGNRYCHCGFGIGECEGCRKAKLKCEYVVLIDSIYYDGVLEALLELLTRRPTVKVIWSGHVFNPKRVDMPPMMTCYEEAVFEVKRDENRLVVEYGVNGNKSIYRHELMKWMPGKYIEMEDIDRNLVFRHNNIWMTVSTERFGYYNDEHGYGVFELEACT
jgi:hypothetical protein